MGFIFGLMLGNFSGAIVGGWLMWKYGNLRFEKPDISTKPE